MKNITQSIIIISFLVFGLISKACDFPINFSASNITGNTADLSWSSGINATTYTIKYKSIGGVFNYKSCTSTSLTLDFLNPNTSYICYIQTTCTNGQSVFSSPPLAFSTTNGCGKALNLTSLASTYNAQLSWEAVNGADLYFVKCRSLSGDVILTSTTTNSITIDNLKPETNYQWYVRAVCSNGDAGYNETPSIFITDKACSVPMNLVSAPSDDYALVSWDDVASADKYTVRYKSANGSYKYETIYGNSCSLSNLTPNKKL